MLTMRDDEGLALLGDLRRRGFTATVSPDDPTRLRVTPPPEEADVRAIVAYKPALLDRLRREARLLALGTEMSPPYQPLAWPAQGVTLGATEAVWRETVPRLHPLALGAFTGVAARRAAGLGPGDRRSVDETAFTEETTEMPMLEHPAPATQKTTSIAWTEHSWNPWRGCAKVTAGCERCYAEAMAKTFGWDFTRVRRTGPDTWRKPPLWDRRAAAAGLPARVFACSISDWFHPDADPWRGEAWAVVRQTPHLQWQILTKRANRIADQLPPDWGPTGYPNVWLGVSVEDGAKWWRASRYLARVPAAVRFVSYEPALGPLALTPAALREAGVDWLICGGESGRGARPMELDWARQARDACREAGVAFFMKQTGAVLARRIGLRDEKGEDPAEWRDGLADLAVRTYPEPKR